MAWQYIECLRVAVSRDILLCAALPAGSVDLRFGVRPQALLLTRILVRRRICRRTGAAHTLGERLCRPVLRKGSAFPWALQSKSRSDSWVEAAPQPARRSLAEPPRIRRAKGGKAEPFRKTGRQSRSCHSTKPVPPSCNAVVFTHFHNMYMLCYTQVGGDGNGRS